MSRLLATTDSLWAQRDNPVFEFLTTGCRHGKPCLWYVLAACYGVLALFAAVQLVRIQIRLGQFGWTMQKVFHFFNLLVCVMRAGSLGVWNELEKHKLIEIVFFDLPNLAFFTSYTLLILFWAEIVHAARAKLLVPPRFVYTFINLALYCVAICLWALGTLLEQSLYSKTLTAYLQVFMSALAALGFLVYGWRLLVMLMKSPVRSLVRRKKIQEVGLITSIAVACFVTKAVLFWLSLQSAFWMPPHEGADYKADVHMDKTALLMNFLFFALAEVLVIGSSLGILSTLPPHRRPAGYQGVPAREVLQNGLISDSQP
eukprot:evm.model.scf_2376EXC.2 EVM.evm.TU.scf_2376EXC.2   scf_2376EXC:14485-16154(-)